MAQRSELDDALRTLVLQSETMAPDELPLRVRALAERAGATDVELLIVDLAQQTLVPLLPGDHRNAYPVDDSPAGEAFRSTAITGSPVAGGRRQWVPVMDSAERVGVLGVTVPEGEPMEGWRALASLTGELLVAKARYGDGIGRARRTRAATLAAEMRWALLPPLTFRSPDVAVTGILEPAYEIAGDTFDYAINGDTLHLAILDAMGHGLEASRMANVAVSAYRHSRKLDQGLQESALAIDEAVQACFDQSRYVTGQLATLDVETRRFRMLNMGHPLPLLLRGGSVEGELPSEPMLPAGWGSKPAAIYEARLEPGDQVLMYTDGVTEARSASGEQYGTDRMVALLEAALAASKVPEEILRGLIDEIMRFQDFHAGDDATLLLLTVPETAG